MEWLTKPYTTTMLSFVAADVLFYAVWFAVGYFAGRKRRG